MDTVKESHKKFILKFELVIGRTCDRTTEKKGSQDKVSLGIAENRCMNLV